MVKIKRENSGKLRNMSFTNKIHEELNHTYFLQFYPEIFIYINTAHYTNAADWDLKPSHKIGQ